MSNFILRIEVKPGSDIANCATEATQLANRLLVTVVFTFNGVHCMACPGDLPESLENEFFRLLNSDKPYKLARGRASQPDSAPQA